jgi:glycosidase
MKWDTLQLMIYGENLNGVDATFINDKLNVIDVHSVENSSYLFVDIEILSNTEPGDYELQISKNGEEVSYLFPIYDREQSSNKHWGFSNEDIIYLIFADRFCDGNPANNTIGDSLDEFTSANLNGRKGGDIEGIISKLDYLKEFGVSSLWITPMLENNMWMSYHGYAATDLYKIDPRFGSNELYKQLVNEAHERGLKIILDHVSNHIGINHNWINNLPESSWINGTPENHLPASHDKMAFLDIHGDSTLVNFTQQGWFEDYMPDLNQRNSFLKNYLIQNTLWWIEYSGIDGIREDTYPYSDQVYLAEWAEAILQEYPNFNIVGEIWKGVPSIISGYQSNSPIRKIDYDSNLPAVTDFALADAIRWYLSGDKPIYQVYETLAQDIVYSDPENLLVFMDNHDIERGMYLADGNIDKFKIALNLVFFTRGIPIIFYGTEIGIIGSEHHGELRQPSPGGFNGDERNAFTTEGRTDKENEIYDYLSKLLKLRNENQVLAKGKLTQIYPGGDIIFFIKTYKDETVLIILNSGDKVLPIHSSQIRMFLPYAEMLKNLISGEEIYLSSEGNLIIKGFSTQLFLLKE